MRGRRAEVRRKQSVEGLILCVILERSEESRIRKLRAKKVEQQEVLNSISDGTKLPMVVGKSQNHHMWYEDYRVHRTKMAELNTTSQVSG
jgi:S-adenosylmethionine:tRNA-ribosyltransferase-isomerase (queuine synthetase)